MSQHRKIWQQHHGPIPKDSDGRSMEIHHIDGDHSNNNISNLKLVTIDEHYRIHYDQGDYGACVIMSHRMKLSPQEISNLSKKCQKRLIDENRHHWQGSAHNQDLINRGIHPFLNRNAARERNLKRIAEGRHNLIGESNPVHKLIEKGQHHFQTNNPIHNLLKSGNHAAMIKLSCIYCRKVCSKNNFNRMHKNCQPPQSD